MNVVLFFAILALVLAFSAIKVVPQGRQWTVERFGRYIRTLRPGISFLIPFVDRIGRRLSMMETVLDVPRQDVITKDNAVVSVDAVVFIQIIDASKAAYEVESLNHAILNLCLTNVRTVVGSMDLDEVLSQRDAINARFIFIETPQHHVLSFAMGEACPGLLSAPANRSLFRKVYGCVADCRYARSA